MLTKETLYWILTWNKDSDVKPNDVIGKYLFFSDDKSVLQKVGEDILREYNLPSMKISTGKNSNAESGFGYVLCIYTDNFSLKDILKNKEVPGLNYRYFKTDDATRAGKYSNQYRKTQ